MNDFEDLAKRIRAFRDARDWMQFHNPKNLACSIVIEASELLEHFQWKTPEESAEHAIVRRDVVAEEMADVAIYLIELADNLGINLSEAVDQKLTLNEVKYPIEKAKGRATKSADLDK